MNLGRILLIESDQAKARLRALALRKPGYDVEVQFAARTGFERAVNALPDCIVCNVLLEDIDGLWVARRLRTEESSVAHTPFLFLSPPEERESFTQGLKVGADAYLIEPVSDEELLSQVSALIGMSRRLRPKQELFVDVYGGASDEGAALKGDLSQMSLATILMILEMERRRGIVSAVTVGGRKASLVIAESGFVSSELDGKDAPPTEVLREVLHWKRGRFWYHTEAPVLSDGKAPPIRGSIGALLLDAMRLGDEATVLAPDEIEVDMAMPSSRKFTP